MDDLIDVSDGTCERGVFGKNRRARSAGAAARMDYWKRHETRRREELEALKRPADRRVQRSAVAVMPKVEKVNALVGSFVNLPYRLRRSAVRFLDDGAHISAITGSRRRGRCFGVSQSGLPAVAS
jgi:hypothetical protein